MPNRLPSAWRIIPNLRWGVSLSVGVVFSAAGSLPIEGVSFIGVPTATESLAPTGAAIVGVVSATRLSGRRDELAVAGAAGAIGARTAGVEARLILAPTSSVL